MYVCSNLINYDLREKIINYKNGVVLYKVILYHYQSLTYK